MPKIINKIIKFMTTKRQVKQAAATTEAPLVEAGTPTTSTDIARVTVRKRIKMRFMRVWYWILWKKEEVRTGVSVRQRVKRYNAIYAEKGDR